MAQVVAVAGPQGFAERSFLVVSVLVFIDVHGGIGPEIHRIGAGTVAAVEGIGVEELRSQHFPATRAAAIHEAGPALANAPETLLDLRNEFKHNGIAVRAIVGAVHGIAVVIEGRGMLYLHGQYAGKVGPGPLFIKLVSFLLHHAVVAMDAKAGIVIRFQVGVRRLGAKAAEVIRKMAVKYGERVFYLRVLVKSFGQQHMGAQVHGAAPEFCEQFALDADVFDVLAVFGRFNGRNFTVQRHGDGAFDFGVQLRPVGLCVEVARCQVPVLAFAAVHGQLHGVAIFTGKGLVFVQQGLNAVPAGLHGLK